MAFHFPFCLCQSVSPLGLGRNSSQPMWIVHVHEYLMILIRGLFFLFFSLYSQFFRTVENEIFIYVDV